jgi:DNA helicase II / ATP-dependent DNA helicase PcrA
LKYEGQGRIKNTAEKIIYRYRRGVDMINEYLVFGPPGTGKTTKLKELVGKAIEDVGKENIMVASFSKAAAMELKARDLKLDDGQIGTLHSQCYKLLGAPKIAEVNTELWNARHPVLEIKKQSIDFDDETLTQNLSEGQRLLLELNILRAKMADVWEYPSDVFEFHQKWAEFKKENGLYDFCDLIEETYRNNMCPEYTVGFFDEAQDFTPLELALVRNWGRSMKYYILALDDDQLIYHFKGCSTKGFLDNIPNKNITILEQSYRLPVAVQLYADKYIKNVRNRVEKKYKPRNFQGEVIHSYLRYLDKESVVNDLKRYVNRGKTVMVLTTCSYMLFEIISELRKNAIPFHNPYRKKRGDWNPLGVSKGTERLLSFLKPKWTNNDVCNWAQILKSKTAVLHGAKKLIKALKDNNDPFEEFKLNMFFTDSAIAGIRDRNVGWFYKNTLPENQNGLRYPISIYKRYGKDTLEETPKIIIGTIHSVKGGESDVVYLFPDISASSARELAFSSDKADELTRLFYVGMTRTRDTLILCQPATKHHYAI